MQLQRSAETANLQTFTRQYSMSFSVIIISVYNQLSSHYTDDGTSVYVLLRGVHALKSVGSPSVHPERKSQLVDSASVVWIGMTDGDVDCTITSSAAATCDASVYYR